MATVHSSTCAEALQRVVGAFPAEIQSSVAAQLADCLLGVISQRLRFRPDLGIRVPECEILMASTAIKAMIRTRDFFKIPSMLETGGELGMWSYQRYRKWLDARTNWHVPSQTPESPDSEEMEPAPPATQFSGPVPTKGERSPEPPAPVRVGRAQNVIEIEPVEGEFGKILRRPE